MKQDKKKLNSKEFKELVYSLKDNYVIEISNYDITFDEDLVFETPLEKPLYISKCEINPIRRKKDEEPIQVSINTFERIAIRDCHLDIYMADNLLLNINFFGVSKDIHRSIFSHQEALLISNVNMIPPLKLFNQTDRVLDVKFYGKFCIATMSNSRRHEFTGFRVDMDSSDEMEKSLVSNIAFMPSAFENDCTLTLRNIRFILETHSDMNDISPFYIVAEDSSIVLKNPNKVETLDVHYFRILLHRSELVIHNDVNCLNVETHNSQVVMLGENSLITSLSCYNGSNINLNGLNVSLLSIIGHTDFIRLINEGASSYNIGKIILTFIQDIYISAELRSIICNGVDTSIICELNDRDIPKVHNLLYSIERVASTNGGMTTNITYIGEGNEDLLRNEAYILYESFSDDVKEKVKVKFIK